MSTRDDDSTQPTAPRYSREAAAQSSTGQAPADPEQGGAPDGVETSQAAGERATAPQPPVPGPAPQPPTASTAADARYDTSRLDATALRGEPTGAAPSHYRSAPTQPAGYDLAPRPSPYAASSTSSASTAGVPAYAAGASAPYAAAASAPYAGSAPAAGGAGGGSGRPPYEPVQSGDSAAAASGGGRRRRRGPGWGGVVAVSLVAAALASGGTALAVRSLDDTSSTSTAAATTHASTLATGSTTKTVSSTQAAPDWESVTTAVGNSVVSIIVATSSGTAEGSGVIYDSSGHIITNNHVVDGATQIRVTLADGLIYSAKVTGTDSATDLAVIQLENAPSDLTVAQFGDSDAVATGEDVMAIGNPLGLSSTATTGIVSALNRPVVTTTTQSDSGGSSSGGLGDLFGQGQSQSQSQSSTDSNVYTNAIQIDAAVNPGNSGGPLFDETGQVIGITSSIASMSSSSSSESGSIGIGFAIPSNLVQKVADQLISSGTATHAYLGVSIGDGEGTVNGATRAGAQVGSVESSSPASKAGLKEGDVVTAIDGKATTQAAALTGFVRQYSAGDTVTLTVIRDGKEISVKVTLAERQDS